MKKLLLAIIAIVAAGSLSAQVHLKTNALVFLGGAPNLGLEFGISKHSTIAVEGLYSPFWDAPNFSFDGFVVTPEYRYYFCEAFNGHYLGVHGNYTQYDKLDILDKQPKLDGTGYGAGLTYGYTWKFSHRWSLDAFIGAGWMRFDSDKYELPTGQVIEDSHVTDKISLDRLGVSVGYRF